MDHHHRLTAEDTRFFPLAHASCEPSKSDPAELIDNAERALQAITALPHLEAFANRAIAELQRLSGGDRFETITAFVAYGLRVRLNDLMSKSRAQHTAFARQMAMYLCRRLTHQSFPQIGRYFDRDHATAIHAYRLIERRMNNDVGFRHTVELLERDLSSITGTLPAA
jgi:chromosomal replication initiation ATPase DnaA